MGALVWLLIPAVAAVFAAIWARWAVRKRVTHDGASLAGYERFRAAMETVPDKPARPAPAEAGTDPQEAAEAAGTPAGAPGERGGRRRRIILSGHGAGGGHRRRTAAAQAAVGAGEEDSPKRPVTRSFP
ncbi:hypothetical protein [Streptomyces sp. NPDC020917]|uniref:hypothetical protein n=1 Tax=Streptomyces sp. NPDC020917 TaxID=3365102 RepID=UPI0037B0DAC0